MTNSTLLPGARLLVPVPWHEGDPPENAEFFTIKAAILRAMDEWKRGGTRNIDRMREQIDTLVEEAIGEWQVENVDATTDEEELDPPYPAQLLGFHNVGGGSIEVFEAPVQTDLAPGFYWWPCSPGCLPDTDEGPNGPFRTVKEAYDDAVSG